MPGRDCGLPHDARNIVGTSGNVVERPTCSRRTILCNLRQFKEYDISLSKSGRQPQNSSIPVRRFRRGAGVYDHPAGTSSHSGVVDYPRLPISELYLGKFPDSMEIQSWKVNFKTEVCSKTVDSHLTMQRIKEVEIAKSIDDLVTSQSITGRKDFPDHDMLDAMIPSALKKLLNTQIHFRERVSVEEQRVQKYDRFLLGTPIAYMIYEHFRATGSCEAEQGLSDSFKKRLQNGDVQGFDVRWDQALLSEDLLALLIAVRNELHDRGEDALVELVYQLMDRLLDDDTSEIADDARAYPPSSPPLVRNRSTVRSHDRRQRRGGRQR